MSKSKHKKHHDAVCLDCQCKIKTAVMHPAKFKFRAEALDRTGVAPGPGYTCAG